MKTSRLLIDGDILTYRTCWAVQTEAIWADGIVTTATNVKELESQADSTIMYWQEKLEVEDFIICFSDPKGKYFRHKILEDYKGNRKSGKKPLGYHHLADYLKNKYVHLVLPECEADDALGILATDPNHKGRNIIISIDKDMRTIPCEYFNMDTEVTELIEEPVADFMHMWQTLVGDSTDNYKGCPGIGTKKAADLLNGPSALTLWERVVGAFEKAGLTKEDALVQARVARILRDDDYDIQKGEVILWEPKSVQNVKA